jgi:predicted methyltransferase
MARMKRMMVQAAAAALMLASGGLAGCATGPVIAPTTVRQAVADQRRPSSDVALDATRRGPEVLAFADIKPGMKVSDIMQGTGYYTRLFAAKVGETGKVYAWSPEEFIATKPERYRDPLDILSHDYPGRVIAMRSPFEALVFPEPLDLIFTSQNYHDLHLSRLPAALASEMNAKVFKSLKPGGVYLVIDHAANPDTVNAPNTVHRIDPAVLRREIEAAGFRFEGESSALRNLADDHKLSVVNPVIRGHTDQIIYRFRKPR